VAIVPELPSELHIKMVVRVDIRMAAMVPGVDSVAAVADAGAIEVLQVAVAAGAVEEPVGTTVLPEVAVPTTMEQTRAIPLV
jgi:hypothetical protein